MQGILKYKKYFKDKNILITGGSGHLAKFLIKKLIALESNLTIYDLRKAEDFKDIDFIQGDIKNKEKVVLVCKNKNYVFHLAASLPQTRLSPKEFHNINVEGTKNIIEGCLKYKVSKLVFPSTIEVYGAQKIERPLKETEELKFTGEYSKNKYECEKLLKDAYQDYGLETVALRLPLILGAGLKHEKIYLTLFEFVRLGFPIFLPTADIPFHAVAGEDAADAFILAVVKENIGGEVFNIASTDIPLLIDLMKDFVRCVKSKSKVISLPPLITNISTRVLKLFSNLHIFFTPAELIDYAITGGAYDISKAQKMLNFFPKKNLLDAMIDSYEWYVKEEKGYET